jgi:hypothetical protein
MTHPRQHRLAGLLGEANTGHLGHCGLPSQNGNRQRAHIFILGLLVFQQVNQDNQNILTNLLGFLPRSSGTPFPSATTNHVTHAKNAGKIKQQQGIQAFKQNK